MKSDQVVLLTRDEAARFLGIKKSTLENWACNKVRGPAFHRVGRCVRYKLSDLVAFLDAHRVESEDSNSKDS